MKSKAKEPNMTTHGEEFRPIEQNLIIELRHLQRLRSKYKGLDKIINLLTESVLQLKIYTEVNNFVSCYHCSKIIDKDYIMINGVKYCNDCAERIRELLNRRRRIKWK